MDAVLRKVVLLFAFTGILGVLASPASGTERQVSACLRPTHEPFTDLRRLPSLTVPVALSSPPSVVAVEITSLPLPMVPRQLVVPSVSGGFSIPTETLPTTMSSIVASTSLPTTLLTITSSQAANPETASRNPDISASSYPAVWQADATNSTISLAAFNRDPFTPTCRTSALRALWSWRSRCDRSPLDHMKHHCWNRAPSVSRCCDDPNAIVYGLSADEAVRRGAPGTCKRYWPKSREEEFMCCGVEREGKGDFGEGSGRWGWCEGEDGGRVPERGRRCECVERKCGEN